MLCVACDLADAQDANVKTSGTPSGVVGDVFRYEFTPGVALRESEGSDGKGGFGDERSRGRGEAGGDGAAEDETHWLVCLRGKSEVDEGFCGSDGLGEACETEGEVDVPRCVNDSCVMGAEGGDDGGRAAKS